VPAAVQRTAGAVRRVPPGPSRIARARPHARPRSARRRGATKNAS